jgi:hypothetical protein
MALSDINHASNHIQRQANIIKENVKKLEYDWDEVLSGLPEKDKEEIQNTITTAVSAIEMAVNRIADV